MSSEKLVPFGVEHSENGVILSSRLELSVSDLEALQSIADSLCISIGDVIMRSVQIRISAHRFVLDCFKSRLEKGATTTAPVSDL